MVFTNPIMITHVNMTENPPPMSLIVAGGYKNANVANPIRGYQKPSIVIAPILDHKNGHYVNPNKVALKYHDFKRDVDLNVHVRMFNFVVKTNVKTLKSTSMRSTIC
jgi:hypothetical protein